jgi:putative ABC transport system ATP-binding protein
MTAALAGLQVVAWVAVAECQACDESLLKEHGNMEEMNSNTADAVTSPAQASAEQAASNTAPVASSLQPVASATPVAETPVSVSQVPVVIHMDNVVKTYVMGDNKVFALRGLTFTVHQGEFLSIMGPSGSGKSTCMNMIGCLDRPTSGIVEIDGRRTAEMNEKELAVLRNKTIGFVFQQYHLLPSMNVLENVMLPLRYQGVEKEERMVMAEAALERVGLADRMKHRPYELSGGQKQRVAIARATVTHPQIILADEPTGALDSETGKAVLTLFAEINKAGTTIVIVTHDPKIGASTPRCIRILDGKIQSDANQVPVPWSKEEQHV